ncbi:zinc-binding dehydrogenase [Cohnella mopanensis]|uniref:zinc-binding dehydrogenase n=1 Tax=Cohnella mopanensis TaxID=2911966 RepID=UPI001EF805DD
MIQTNQAIRFTGKQQASLVQCDWEPSPLAADEIIGRTIVSLISNGSEMGAYMDHSGGMKYPVETGYAAILEVLEVGEEVTNVRVGEHVLALSPHQAYSRVKFNDYIPVPVGMKPEHAVIGRFPAVSMTSMIHSRIRPTESVMVTGLGIVGLMCAQVMQHCGYEVYAFDPNEGRRATARSCGLRHVYTSPDEVPGLKGTAGLAIDCSGREEAVYSLLANLRKGGELYLVGVPWFRSTDKFAHDLLRSIFYGYVQVNSGWEWSLPRHSSEFHPNSNHGSIRKAMEWIRDGLLQVENIYDIYAPSACGEVYAGIADSTLTKPCVIFDWSLV